MTVSGLQMGALSPSVEPWLGDPVSMSCYIHRALHIPPLLCKSAALRREHLTAVVRCPGPEMPSRGHVTLGPRTGHTWEGTMSPVLHTSAGQMKTESIYKTFWPAIRVLLKFLSELFLSKVI